jgi:Domain of unknown function (DUF1707)
MDLDSRSFPRGGIRVSDADRDRAVSELGEHFQTGRLTQDEFEDRSGQALRARTGEDLSALFTDLPQRPPAQDLQPAPDPAYRAGRPGAARAVIALVILAVIAANVVGANSGHEHGHGFGWLVPVLILGFVFLRLIGRRRR